MPSYVEADLQVGLKLGTRGSELALFQARTAAALLERRCGVSCEIVVIKTSGDRLAEAALSEIGGKRLFVKEIEDALLAGDIDLAVHSSKDMPAVLPDGLDVGAVLPREDPRDALILPESTTGQISLDEIVRVLGRSPRIGTSSVRRRAQLTRLFPGATFLPIRGNLDTRLRKLDSGQYDAIVLAAAGLRRLERQARISTLLPADACVPAPGQGIIAVEIRSSDERLRGYVSRIDDRQAAIALRSERSVVMRLGGGCQMPIGAYADVEDDAVTLTGIVISVDGARVARATAKGRAEHAEAIGLDVAEQLLERGAGEILADVQRAQAAVEGIQP
jgi:hydroxymethylbilane synthase